LKNCLHWKIVYIEKLFTLKKQISLKKMLHLQNVVFKIVFSTWWKLMYENFHFPLEKNYENDYVIWVI